MQGSIKQCNQYNYQRLIIIDKSKRVASNMAVWSLRLLYLNNYPSQEGGVLSFRPQQIQVNKFNYHRLISLDKSKMAASKMAGWILKRLYIGYSLTQIGDVLGVMVQQMQWIQLKYHMLFFDKSKMATSKMAVSKMASFCNLLSCTSLSTVTFDHYIGVTFIFTTRQPLRIHCPGGRRRPNVYEFATISVWCTDG